MGFEHWGFEIPAVFVTGFTIVLGGGLALVAWAEAAMRPREVSHPRIPTALWFLTSSVCCNLIGLLVMKAMPGSMQQRMAGEFPIFEFTWSSFLVVGFVLALLSLFTVRRARISDKRTIYAGSSVVVLVNVAGFILYLFG